MYLFQKNDSRKENVMSNEIKSIYELKDSVILYEKKMPVFIKWLIILTMVLVVVLVIIAMNTPKINVIKSSGTICVENTEYIMSPHSGKISQCVLVEGMYVKKGDVLFEILTDDFSTQYEQLNLLKEYYSIQIKNYELLKKSIKDKINYFLPITEETEIYSNMYNSYLAKVEQNTFDKSIYELLGYPEEQMNIEMEKNQALLNEIYYSTLQSVEDAIYKATFEKQSIESQQAIIESKQQLSIVKASETGIIHLYGEYKDGIVVQSGTVIASVAPESDGKCITTYVTTSDFTKIKYGDNVQVAIDGLNQSIYGTIKGYIKSIDKDSTSVSNGNGVYEQKVKVLIKLENDYLADKDSDRIYVENGMTAEVRIQYDEMSWFGYFWDKIRLDKFH